jgi:hypothetical protein
MNSHEVIQAHTTDSAASAIARHPRGRTPETLEAAPREGAKGRSPNARTRGAAFADALDRAAGPRPGSEFEALTEALRELGRVLYDPWMPEGDEATVARWVRQALSPVLHSPFEGPRGAADHETLSNVLRYAEGWESVKVDEDEERTADRVMFSMVRAALAI